LVFRAVLPTLDPALLNNSSFKKDFGDLFNSSHLQFLHSDYFGSGSSRRKGSFPCRDALKGAFISQQKREETSEPYVMKMALSRYMVNFKNMWLILNAFIVYLTMY